MNAEHYYLRLTDINDSLPQFQAEMAGIGA
jgi:hypothetical protein